MNNFSVASQRNGVSSRRVSLRDFEPFAGAVLTRVSTPGQVADGVSLETQEEGGRDDLALMDIPCVAIYEDAGLSGDMYISRPALQQMLTDLRAGRFNVLVVYDTSRLSWSTEYLPRILREIHEAGGRVYLRTFGEFIDPDNHDQEFAIGVLNAADKRYRRHLRAASIAGKRQTAKQGRQPYRIRVPFGYRIVTEKDILAGRDAPGTAGKYIVLSEPAETVRLIFTWYACEGLSLRQIGLRLEGKDVASPLGSKKWHGTTIRNILQNPVYYGEARSHVQKRIKDENRIGKVGKHDKPYISAATMVPAPESGHIVIPAPAIISREMWEQAQVRLSENKRLASGPTNRKHLLTGLVLCPHCGASLKVRSAGGARKDREESERRSCYRCEACYKEGRTDRYSENYLERYVADALNLCVTSPEVMNRAIDLWESRQSADTERARLAEDVERCAKAVAAIEKRREGILRAADDEPDFIADGIKKLAQEWRQAKSKLSDAERRLRDFDATEKRAAPETLRQAASLALSVAGEMLTDASVPLLERRAALTHLVAAVIPDVKPSARERFSGVTLITRALVGDSAQCMGIHVTESSFEIRILGRREAPAPIPPAAILFESEATAR